MDVRAQKWDVVVSGAATRAPLIHFDLMSTLMLDENEMYLFRISAFEHVNVCAYVCVNLSFSMCAFVQVEEPRTEYMIFLETSQKLTAYVIHITNSLQRSLSLSL